MGEKGNPPPYSSTQNSSTPAPTDNRPLPDGWVSQYDNNYKRYFYVDTRAKPPRSTWTHPADENGAQQQHQPPPGPPPGQDSRGQAYSMPQQRYPQQPMMGGGYQQPMMGGYQQPMMGGYQQPMMGGSRFGRMGGMGGMGGGMGGLGAGLLGGGAGLLGDHMEHDAYMDGYQQGEMNDMGGGGDFGGGDFGGGDFGGGDF